MFAKSVTYVGIPMEIPTLEALLMRKVLYIVFLSVFVCCIELFYNYWFAKFNFKTLIFLNTSTTM